MPKSSGVAHPGCDVRYGQHYGFIYYNFSY